MNTKTLILCLLATIILSSYVSNDKINSGLKFSFDVDYVKLLQNLDISKFVNGKVVVDGKGIEIKKDGIFGYDIHIKKAVVDSVQLPENISVVNTKEQGSDHNGITNVAMKGLKVNLLVDFDVKISLFSDSVTNSPLKIIIDEIDGQYTFKDGLVSFSKLQIKLGDIDIKFNATFYKVVYWAFKGLIIKQIEKAIPKAQADIEKALNKLVTTEIVVKVPVVSLYFNATSIDRPVLSFIDEAKLVRELFVNTAVNDKSNEVDEVVEYEGNTFTKSEFSTLKENELDVLNTLIGISKDKLYSIFSEFLENYLEFKKENIITKEEAFESGSSGISTNQLTKSNLRSSLKANNQKTFLEFGISGYAFIDPTHSLAAPRAVDMHLTADSHNRGATFLLSDFTVNSLLYIVQQTGMLRIKVDKNTKIKDLPFAIDTDGLQILFPELADRYKEKKNAILKIEVSPLMQSQPTIGTSIENIHFKTMFNLELLVEESDDPFDDPVSVLVCDNLIVVDLIPSASSDKLTIGIHDATVEQMTVVNTLFNPLNIERVRTQLNHVLNVALDSMVRPLLQNIDVNAFVEKYTPFSITSFTFDMVKGYNSISFDVQQKKK